MWEAIELAEQGKFTAPPNPHVGALVVRDERVIGRGYHEKPGMPHAEVVAFKGIDAIGATLFVTLEPCCHYGRTPPCVEAVINAGIKEVFVGTLDPDERVKGKGVDALQKAGIKVHIGLLENEVKKSLAAYLHHRKTALPYVIAKAAITIDGRIAHDKVPQWISCETAREDVHHLRRSSQAILIGSKTARLDNPRLTVRLPNIVKQPLRVVVDSKGVIKEGHLLDLSLAPTLMATNNQEAVEFWSKMGVEALCYPGERIPLKPLLQDLAKRGVLQLLVEGGGELFGSLFEENLVQELITYTGPKLYGDKGKPLITSDPLPDLTLLESYTLGQTVKSRYIVT